MAENQALVYFVDQIPFIVSIVFLVLLFGHLLYLAVLIFNISEKSEEFEKSFYLRSMIIALIAVGVVVFLQFIFALLLFSPLFWAGESTVRQSLILSVLSSSLSDIAINILATPPIILSLLLLMVVVIVAINSLIMLDFYKVNYGWTTLMTWTAIGIYFGIDFVVSLGVEDGMAGVFRLIGAGIRSLIPV